MVSTLKAACVLVDMKSNDSTRDEYGLFPYVIIPKYLSMVKRCRNLKRKYPHETAAMKTIECYFAGQFKNLYGSVNCISTNEIVVFVNIGRVLIECESKYIKRVPIHKKIAIIRLQIYKFGDDNETDARNAGNLCATIEKIKQLLNQPEASPFNAVFAAFVEKYNAHDIVLCD